MLGLTGPSIQQALAAALDVTPRNVTGLVDGLVGSGHVTREPHPSDRRAILVTPTSLGRRAIDDLRSSHTDLARQLFGEVPDARLATFESTLDETIDARPLGRARAPGDPDRARSSTLLRPRRAY